MLGFAASVLPPTSRLSYSVSRNLSCYEAIPGSCQRFKNVIDPSPARRNNLEKIAPLFRQQTRRDLIPTERAPRDRFDLEGDTRAYGNYTGRQVMKAENEEE